jgi:hypothetical protein
MRFSHFALPLWRRALEEEDKEKGETLPLSRRESLSSLCLQFLLREKSDKKKNVKLPEERKSF